MTPRPLAAALCAALAACSGGDDPPPDPCATAVPGAGWVAYVSRRAGNYDVRLVAADGTCDRALTTDPGDELAPSFSVAANAVAYAAVRAGKQVVLVHDLASGEERVLDTGGLSAANPAISPDGATVAFEGRAAAGDDADVFLIPLAGGAAPVAVAPSDAADGGPAWGDDETLYFVSDRGSPGSFEVWRARTDGSDPEPLTSWATRADGTGALVGKPAVSPDGLELAFARTASSPGFSRVVVRTIATGAERILAARDDSEPSFDPRGGAVAVTTWESGDAEVVVRALADGAAAPLTASPGTDGAPSYAR